MNAKLEALKERIELLETEPMIGEFVIKQNEVQIFLSDLLMLRSNKQGLVDKKLIRNIYSSTLGKTIMFFKFFANKTDAEKILIKKLEEYNKYRNKLIHNENLNYKLDKRQLEKINKSGVEILQEVFDLIKKELIGHIK